MKEFPGPMQLPRYVCHKEVGAFQIERILTDPQGVGTRMTVLTGQGCRVVVTDEWMDRHEPQVGGYLVEYEDGYRSFSPPGPFESGYRPK